MTSTDHLLAALDKADLPKRHQPKRLFFSPWGRIYEPSELSCYIRRHERNSYLVVPGRGVDSAYVVDLEEHGCDGSCTCDDYLFRGHPELAAHPGLSLACKHIHLVRYILDRGETLPVAVFPEWFKLPPSCAHNLCERGLGPECAAADVERRTFNKG